MALYKNNKYDDGIWRHVLKFEAGLSHPNYNFLLQVFLS
jgi:hypothetical protein